MITLTVDPHPLLDARAFTTSFPAALGPAPEWLTAQLALTAAAPLASSDEIRAAIRDLLRHGGFKPTGRSKPASEYLLRTAGEPAGLSSINPLVDACNVVSLHSGLPVSVVDLELLELPLRIGVAKAGESYVFNASGHVIDLEGLLCLFDAKGPCANAVKDAQRTKTRDATLRTLSVVWGSKSLGDATERAVDWYREILAKLGATTEPVA